jgi:hypothetical protein
VASIEEAPEMEAEPVRPVLRRLPVVEDSNRRVRPPGGEEESGRREKDEPGVAEDDDGEEVAREVQPQERRTGVRVPIDRSVHGDSGLSWLRNVASRFSCEAWEALSPQRTRST